MGGTTQVGSAGGLGIVFNSGSLTTGSLLAAAGRLGGTGSINTHGLVTDVNLVFDQSHGLQQQVLLNSKANQNVTINLDVNGAGDLGAGYAEQGSLMIAAGRVVSSTDNYLGYLAGSKGEAIVNGSGSTWKYSGSMQVGFNGEGSLTISNGGQVMSTADSASYVPVIIGGSKGAITVDGIASKITYNQLQVAGSNGTLHILNGGYVGGGSGSIGVGTGSAGTATVEGIGSTWRVADSLAVGYYDATGTLNIIGGGAVEVVPGDSANGDVSLGALFSGANGTINLVNGVLRMYGGTLAKGDGSATFNFIGGRLEGAGTIDLGHVFVQSAGTLAPGSSTGKTTIQGGYTLDGGTLELDLNSTSGVGVGWHEVKVAGPVNLLGSNGLADGRLNIHLGFAPSVGSGFRGCL